MKSYRGSIKILLTSKKDNKKTNQKDHKKDLVKIVGFKRTCPRWHLGQVK